MVDRCDGENIQIISLKYSKSLKIDNPLTIFGPVYLLYYISDLVKLP
jgi:hypothetical protein